MALAGAALGSASCGDTSLGRSPSILVIDDLTGAQGNNPGSFGGNLQSDVATKGSIYEDLGQVTMHVEIKDLGNPGADSSPSQLNQVTVNRYHVEFKRADGRNTQGVDVPYAFDGAMTMTVGTSLKFSSFTLVRIQAKLEPPLRALVNQGGKLAISTIAEVTFYGQDLAGNPVYAVGSIGINFADWADPS